MRKKIAVVGDKGSVLGFKSVGFEVFMTTTQQETREVMQALCKADYGIIFITEQAYLQVPEIIDEYKERPTPAIIPIPGKDGNLGRSPKSSTSTRNVRPLPSFRFQARTATLASASKMSRKTSRELSAQTSSSMKISVFVFRPAGLPAEIDLKVGENIEPRQNC